MRCILCHQWSFSHICKACKGYMEPTMTKRKILGNIPVYSFYKYDDIEALLLTKHTDIGFYLYTHLASLSMKPFASSLDIQSPIAVIGIDDNPRDGYSHTAILVRSLGLGNCIARYGYLRSTDQVRYSGKSMQYRLDHPRQFKVGDFPEENVILVDDIITTGLTLSHAVNALQRLGKRVVCCLTLADASK